MKIKKKAEFVYEKEIMQYKSETEFKTDYIKRIKEGWVPDKPYYTDGLTFAYKKLKYENVIQCDCVL